MSYVEMTKTGTFERASGAASEASTPTREKSSGPSTFKQRQPRSHCTSGGTRLASLTIDSSSSVRVIESNSAPTAHPGIGSVGFRRVIAKMVSRRSSRITPYYEDLSPFVTPSTRREAIARLRSETFDLLILGGGINGAGTARDLALRSKTAGVKFSVALVEQNHFASGTSGKNSHLIHGGLRYLKQLDVRLVRESLRERSILLRIAPHLVEPLPFLMPLVGIGREIFYIAGLTLYDVLSGSHGLPHHRRVPLEEVRRLEPGLAVPGMTAAAEYYDARVRSARLVLENVFEAIANGAACANYVRVEDHVKENPGLWRVRLRDTISNDVFEMRAHALIDATGPWAHDPAPRLVRGSHIIFPRINSSDHAIAYFEESGRIIFLIPWGDRTLVGTTDVESRRFASDVQISKEEVEYLRGDRGEGLSRSARDWNRWRHSARFAHFSPSTDQPPARAAIIVSFTIPKASCASQAESTPPIGP